MGSDSREHPSAGSKALRRLREPKQAHEIAPREGEVTVPEALVERFVSAIPGRLSDLEEALSCGDFATAARIAHGLKGLAPMFGYVEAAGYLRGLELAADARDEPACRELLAHAVDAMQNA